jgi:hypothetical protein
MYDEIEVELEDVEVTEGDQTYSYDAKVIVHGRYEDCECSSTYGNQEVTETWQEKDIDDVMLVSYKKYKVSPGLDFDKQVEGEMPKQAWEKIQQQAIEKVDF